MATSEQLEREAEATRARIAATLDELRGRMTPGQIVDQFVDYARDSGGGEFVRNFGQQVVGNPLPVTLVGAGLAWLMLAGRRGPRRDGGFGFGVDSVDDVAARMSEAGDGSAPETAGMRRSAQDAAARTSAGVASLSEHAVRRAQEWGRQTRAGAEQLQHRVGEAGSGLQDRMSSAGASVRDAASSAYDTASATYDAAAERTRQGTDAIGRSARMMSDNLAASGRSLLDFLQQQPLVLAGLGLAIGGLLGAAMPASETEDQLMGEASEAVKREAKSFAQDQVDKGKQVAEHAWNATKPEIDAQVSGATSEARGGSSGEPATATGFGGEAPLVPADETAQAGTADDGARRDTEQHSA
jgi:Protein of unknown function (DUF3618)